MNAIPSDDEGWSALPADVLEALVWWASEHNPDAVTDSPDTTHHLVALVRYVRRHAQSTVDPESAAMLDLALEVGRLSDLFNGKGDQT